MNTWGKIKNLKIKKLLSLNFVIITIAICILTGNTLLRIQHLTKINEQYNENVSHIIETSLIMNSNIIAIDQNIGYKLLTTDKSTIDNNDFDGTINNSFDKLDESLTSIEDKNFETLTFLNELKVSLSILKEETYKVNELVNNGEIEKAKAMVLDTNGTYYENYAKCKELINEINNKSLEWSSLYKEASSKTTKKAYFYSILLFILITTYVGLLSKRLFKRIIIPLNEISLISNKMANGSFENEVSYESDDELGLLLKDISNMQNNIKNIIADIVNVLNEMANGNFTVKPSNVYIGDLSKIEKSINKIINNLSDTLLQINLSASEVNLVSNQLAGASSMLAQGSTEQASAVEELSGTVSSIYEKSSNTAKNAHKVEQVALNSGILVKHGTDEMSKLVLAMQNIEASSSEISKIIKTIDDIAFQTNILSLNASIESARAGEAGKGFAVVADEVRSLANKSAQASKHSSELIEQAINDVRNGMLILNETENSLTKIDETTKETISLIKDISQDTSEQYDSINQVKIGIEQIAEVVQTNSAMSEETASASEELNSQSIMLKELIQSFKLADK